MSTVTLQLLYEYRMDVVLEQPAAGQPTITHQLQLHRLDAMYKTRADLDNLQFDVSRGRGRDKLVKPSKAVLDRIWKALEDWRKEIPPRSYSKEY